MKTSIIIPTFEEERNISGTLTGICRALGNRSDTEIIVSDAGEDRTSAIASGFPVRVVRSPKGRAVQMNRGAAAATGDLLYFIHADTQPPACFVETILSSVNDGSEAGCFQLTFDDPHWLMQAYGWFTRFPFPVCRGGDQSLFITKSLFERIGGFDESLQVMEDIDIIERIEKETPFRILPRSVVTSARKYRVNGRVRLQVIFGFIHLFYALGFDQDIIAKYYSDNIE
ncbi:glycosyl hydrolase [Prosthecochloris sp. GSB1]|uniref:TIGR04283 family arsenosugar biosynthesis glycosyltransferase n=1 Tax=Prosthecochloris sp. GSB1 TaxID=281093 RepID=UPI000B8CE0F6|nr:TIGR04283 family arsenosugar biosynthesis glycosyltransferase [Prosthecochloris sp. GSB1]ASQ90142.1 glycosyl hydrolase [Prosthecochloris sp. GSB1]